MRCGKKVRCVPKVWMSCSPWSSLVKLPSWINCKTLREFNTSIILSLPSCLPFQMWMSVLKKATAARAVPTQRGGSSAGAFRATSSDLTNAAAKLWVKKNTALFFNLDMWPQRSCWGLTSNKNTQLHCLYLPSCNCIHSSARGLMMAHSGGLD